SRSKPARRRWRACYAGAGQGCGLSSTSSTAATSSTATPAGLAARASCRSAWARRMSAAARGTGSSSRTRQGRRGSAKGRRTGASDDEVRLRICLPADGPFFLNHLANAADAWREDFRRCRVLKQFSQGSVYLSANEKMVELDVQWGDGAD